MNVTVRGGIRMNKVVALPTYQRMTIRSWNTTVKLVELIAGP